MPPLSAETVSGQGATLDAADGATRSESDDTTSAVASPPSTPSQNPSVAFSARQAGPATFRPSHPHATVRPPMLLDTAIGVLLVLVFALLCRRVF